MSEKKRFLGKTKVTEQPEPTATTQDNTAEDTLLRTFILREDWSLEKIAEAVHKTVPELLDTEKLTLRNTGIKGIGNVRLLRRLKMLDLSHTHVTDLGPLRSCVHLEWLNLWHTEVKDLNPLKSCINLNAVNITDTQVKNIAPLKELPLSVLQLSFVDKTIFNVLKQLRGLERLYLFGVWLPEDELKELTSTLPQCKIISL
jgi:Leucine-rich repeat (LRR) protein